MQHHVSSRDIYDVEDFLDFKNLRLHGRDEEIAKLNEAYQRCFTSSRPQIVWLKGSPGVGKSALVEHMFFSNDNYCSGKFERLQTSVPYSAVTQLLSKLYYILDYEGHRIESLSSDDEAILAHLVPEITSSRHGGEKKEGAAGDCKVEWGLERLKQALRAFFRAACKVLVSPVILFLDDLQWADFDTLEVLQDVMTGYGESEQQQGVGIMFVGAYRSNEVEEDLAHPLAQCIRTISDRTIEKPGSCICEIHLKDLDEKATNQLVADLTDSKPEKVWELSELVYSKTDGNCFYTLQTLRHIHDTHLLYVSSQTLRWVWDAEGIREEVQMSDNIAAFMTRKMKMLPQPTLDVLTIAAYLGTKVQIELLESLYPLINSDPSPIMELLKPALDGNLVEITRSSKDQRVFKFTHDRVAATAYSMVPEGDESRALHLKIGWHLHNLFLSGGNDGTMKQWQLILAVDQLNRGVELIEKRREQVLLAKLNMTAAQQVIQTGAFKLATQLLETGTALVGVRRWETSYDLTLQLSVTLASVLYSNGRMEESLTLLREIFANAKCVEDKYEAYSIQVEVLESMGEIDKCLQGGIATLAELGTEIRIPRKPHLGQLLVRVFAAQRALRHMTDEDIISLPICTDPKKEFLMRHLNCLSTIAYFSHQENLVMVTSYRVLQLSLQYGVTRYSSCALCVHGFACAAMGNFEAASRFGELAMKLVERFPTDYRTSTFAICVLSHLKKPIHEIVNKSLLVYESAFSSGDLRSAGLACVTNVLARYCAGMPLECIARDGFALCHQLKKFQQSLMLKYLLFMLRPVLELLGRADELSNFVENSQDDIKFERFVASDGDVNGVHTFWQHAMEGRFRLGDIDSAHKFAKKYWRAKVFPDFFVTTPNHLLFFSLTALEGWKRSRKFRYWRIFRKRHKDLESWVEKGNLNSRHMVLLLDAELAAAKGRNLDIVRSMFESAISTASRCGLVNHSALASERAGQYFWEKNDMYWAEYYLSKAHQLYADWDAMAKVTQMEKRYGKLIAPDEFKAKSRLLARAASSSLTGRSRLSVVALVEAKRDTGSHELSAAMSSEAL